jgi:3-oxo-5-alpha-steroid 4-dehydrogenase 3 / polyprenol reductase
MICLWDSISIIGYVCMTLTIYSSYFLPSLNDLASHGKTRINNKSNNGSNTTTTMNKKQPSSSSSSITSFINWFNTSDLFLVKKRYFRQFYIIGILCLTFTIYMYIQMQSQTLQFDMSSNKSPSTTAASLSQLQREHVYEKVSAISTILLYIHLFRRLYECTYVHVWKETSVMHVAGYFVGAIHYIWLPHIFFRLPCIHCIHDQSTSNFLYKYIHTIPVLLDQQSMSQQNQYFDSNNYTIHYATHKVSMIRIFAIVLCLYGQYQQYKHHSLLANIRINKPTTTTTTTKYSLPTSGWFQYITCPHYLSEIIIYISFALLLEQEKYMVTISSSSSSSINYLYYYGYRHYLIVVWVASNLTMSALINYKWYQNNLPNDIMKDKKAIIPFIL